MLRAARVMMLACALAGCAEKRALVSVAEHDETPIGGAWGFVSKEQAERAGAWPLPREKLVFRTTPTLTDEAASGLRAQLKDGSVVPLMVRYLLLDVEGREVKAVWSTTLSPNHTKLDLQKEYEFRLVPGRYGEYNVGHVKDGDTVIFGRDSESY